MGDVALEHFNHLIIYDLLRIVPMGHNFSYYAVKGDVRADGKAITYLLLG